VRERVLFKQEKKATLWHDDKEKVIFLDVTE
jgi:hypothetical protein